MPFPLFLSQYCMLDVSFIKNNPEVIKDSMLRRGVEFDIHDLLSLIAARDSARVKLQDLQAQRNVIAAKIALLKQGKGATTDEQSIIADGKMINGTLQEIRDQEKDIEHRLQTYLSTLPNILSEDVPSGASEEHNLALRKYGNVDKVSVANIRDHVSLGGTLGMMDFAVASKIAGSRFVILNRELALLERALRNFMLDINTLEFGYVEYSLPFLVNEATMYGAGQLPKFNESFCTTDGRYLISTAEVPLTNLMSGEILQEAELPLRFTAYSPCFRSEAGAAGRDTKGMLRQHQFHKVELVSVTTPEGSVREHEYMMHTIETILQRLDLPYRVMLLCAGDTGFCAQKTYDFEVWLPEQGKYREISSCSNTGAFQMRRTNTRLRRADGSKVDPHCLNGSALPIGRTMVAIIENYQNSDGSITIPACLMPYMRNMSKILVGAN